MIEYFWITAYFKKNQDVKSINLVFNEQIENINYLITFRYDWNYDISDLLYDNQMFLQIIKMIKDDL